MNPVRITFDFTLDDWVAYLDKHTGHSPYSRKARRIGMLSIPTIFALVLLMGYMRHNLSFTEVYICVAGSLVWIYAALRSQSHRARKARFLRILTGDNSTILGLQEITVTEEGLTIVYPMAESRFQWQAFKKLITTDSHYFLYDTAVSAVIIPRAKAAGDIAGFEKIVKERVGEINNHS